MIAVLNCNSIFTMLQPEYHFKLTSFAIDESYIFGCWPVAIIDLQFQLSFRTSIDYHTLQQYNWIREFFVVRNVNRLDGMAQVAHFRQAKLCMDLDMGINSRFFVLNFYSIEHQIAADRGWNVTE